ncbi:MAG: EAL domain-containing protein (putative c-di-GMP-specific phosphodiesterase class I) [Polaribacter sp.]|jgi:EAL domain-containing protein (putative c-di-GMP-specific phosphodiesterase class I)/GGDEF domain-containing protein
MDYLEGFMLSKGIVKQSLACLLLAMFMMLVYQYVIAIADPTKNTIQSGQDGFQIDEAFLIDVSQELTLDQLLTDNSSLVKQPLAEIPWSFTQQAYWVHLVIHNNNQHGVDIVSHFSNPMLEQLTVYQVLAHQRVKEKKLGWQVSDLDKLNRSIPSYEVRLEQKETVELYIRIATKGIAKTPINLYLKDDFHNLVRFTFLIWGSFVGILIAMALYNLVLYLGLKDSVYLLYVGYITSMLMMLGVVIGFGHYIWPENILKIFRENIVAVNVLVMIFSLSFALSFFNARKNKTRTVKFCSGYLIYLVVFSFVSLFLPEYIAAPIFFLSMALLYPATVFLIIQQYKINHLWTKLYIVSWAPLILGATLQPLGLVGTIEESFIIHHALMIGVLFEIIIMAMALASRMQYKKEKTIYDVTHEPETQLANTHLLEIKMKELLKHDTDFAVCIIEITELSSLLPYISNADNNDLTLMVADTIERALRHKNNFMVLEYNKNKTTKLAKINEGVFAVLVDMNFTSYKEHECLETQLASLQGDVARGTQIKKLFINLSTRVGISLLEPQKEVLPYDIIKQAYQALDKGAREGVAFSVYHKKEALNVTKRLELASDLQQALRNNELELFHQPQIDINKNTIDGSEVLLRWKHKEYGYIAPDLFIKLAEDTGIINELTLWVVNKACRDLEEIINLGYVNYNVSVNISGKDISEPNFLTHIKKIISQYDIPLSSLTFELTESVMVNDFNHLSHIMNELASMGIHVAIDDYGTGYSSLLYISQLPFNELKIDKSFVMNLETSDRDLTIVKATIEMAKNLGLKVVAEGIESKEIETILKRYGCNILQGYYYQKPVEFRQYLSWLAHFQNN